MALADSQLNPLVLRRRSIPRHTQQHIPRLNDINAHVENYINTFQNQVLSLSFKQQIHYWSSKVSESVHICIDVLLPEFDNFTNIVMIRWLTIGYSLYQLTQLWKKHKNNIQSHTRIDEWLPYIVKQKLPPNLVPRGSYNQLRKYVIMWENRTLVTKLPKLRGEHTHKLSEMSQWIREFNRNVALIASQRNVSIPHNLDQRIDLYKIWLAHHSKSVANDDEKDECKTLDTLVSEYLPGINHNSDNNLLSSDDSQNNGEQKSMELSDDEQNKPKKKLSKKDVKILKYRQKIKELKQELSETKNILKQTKFQHCQAIRERHVLRELQREHKDEMDSLHEIINAKNVELQQLKESNIQLQNTLIDCKEFIRTLRGRFVEYEKMMEKLSCCSYCKNGGGNYSSGSCGSFNETLPENTERYYDENDSHENYIDISDNNNDISSAGSFLYKNFYRNYNRKTGSMKKKLKKAKRNCNKRDKVVTAASSVNGSVGSYISSGANSSSCGDGRQIPGGRRNVNELRKYIIALRKENSKLKEQYNAIVIKLSQIK